MKLTEKELVEGRTDHAQNRYALRANLSQIVINIYAESSYFTQRGKLKLILQSLIYQTLSPEEIGALCNFQSQAEKNRLSSKIAHQNITNCQIQQILV